MYAEFNSGCYNLHSMNNNISTLAIHSCDGRAGNYNIITGTDHLGERRQWRMLPLPLRQSPVGTCLGSRPTLISLQLQTDTHTNKSHLLLQTPHTIYH